MRHIAATRLADLAADKLRGAKRQQAQQHVDGCSSCAASLGRIRQARLAMAEIKNEEAPELGWESIAARIYWSTSSEKRAKARESSKHWRRPAFAVAAITSVAAVSLWSLSERDKVVDAPTLAQETSPAAAPLTQVPPPSIDEVATLIGGLVTFAQGDVRVNQEALRFDQEIVAGTKLSAGNGGLVVQFGEKSAFRLAANSTLEVRRFDSSRIELSVVGVVDVDLTRRLPGQEFVVVAGEHEVVVRGTAFRVAYGQGDLGVSCTRGKVVVSSEQGMVPVPAGQGLRILEEAWETASLQAKPIDPERLRALDAAMYMPMLPAWSERELLTDATTVLEVSAAAEQRVAIDGVAVASGSFFLRAMSGRHQVALMDASGEMHEEKWVEGGAGRRESLNLASASKPAASTLGAAQSKGAQKLRRSQLLAALDESQRSTRCLASLAKQRMKDGSFAVFEMGVTADGTQDYLNLRESNLSPVVVKCLRSAIDAETLPSGPATGFRFRLDF